MCSIVNSRRHLEYHALQQQPCTGVSLRKILSLGNGVHFARRLTLDRKLQVHHGCVNTIVWNETGDYILSGSDDRNLVITNPFNGRVAARIPSGHKQNIFKATFLPGTGNRRIVSCCADGEIRYTQIETPSSYGKNVFNCHSERAYQVLTTPGDPNTFMSSSEDGTVRLFDLREKTSCSNRSCTDNILINCNNAVNSLAIDPLRHYILATGTNDGYVRIFDRRMLNSNDNENRAAIRSFTPSSKPKCRVTHLQFSTDGSHLLANYAPRHVYEISTETCDSILMEASGTNRSVSLPAETPSRSDRLPVIRIRGDWSATGPSAVADSERTDGEPMSSTERGFRLLSQAMTRLLTSQATTEEPDSESSIAEQETAEREAVEQETAERGNLNKSLSQSDNSAQDMEEDVQGGSASQEDDDCEPMTLAHTYEGHRNVRTTIKQCMYWGDDIVVAGSDCGHMYFWRRDTGKLVHLIPADSRVVNCVQAHPTFPVIASSGIDHDIKTWSPLLEEENYDEEKCKTYVKRNCEIVEQEMSSRTMSARLMMQILAVLHRQRREAPEPE